MKKLGTFKVLFAGLWLLIFSPLACGSQKTGSETESNNDSVRGKSDMFDIENLEDKKRDGECDSGNAYNDPDCYIRIASWNIKDFSVYKASTEEHIEDIAETLQHFDVVAVQEISNIREQNDPNCSRNTQCPDHPNCGKLEEALSSQLNDELGKNYGFAFSPQVRQERYLFIYNKDMVELVDHRLMNDPGEKGEICNTDKEETGDLLRQPHLGIFRSEQFSFGLLNIHTQPEDAPRELESLSEFAQRAQESGVSDLIIAGDLNADCQYLSAEQRDKLPLYQNWLWLLFEADTSLSEERCTFDQIMVQEETLEDMTGHLGVISSIDEEISDHYPIWANFFVTRDTDSHKLDGDTEN